MTKNENEKSALNGIMLNNFSFFVDHSCVRGHTLNIKIPHCKNIQHPTTHEKKILFFFS